MGMKRKFGTQRTLKADPEYLGEKVVTKFAHLRVTSIFRERPVFIEVPPTQILADHDRGFARSQRR